MMPLKTSTKMKRATDYTNYTNYLPMANNALQDQNLR